MKKLFFLTNTVDLANPSDGLAKKINAQVKAFEQNGYVTELAGCSNTEYTIHAQKFFLTEEGVLKELKKYFKVLRDIYLLNLNMKYFILGSSISLHIFIFSQENPSKI